MVEEADMLRECHNFFNKNSLLIGGSSGACLSAIKKYCSMNNLPSNLKIVAIFPDKGDRYIDTIYDDNWCRDHFMI